MSEKKETKKKPSWLSDFTTESIKKSAEVDIKPKLTIDGIGIEYAKDITIMSEPYIVEIPKEKSIGADNKIWMIDVSYQEVSHQFIAQSGSFRFQLGVLMEKLNFEPKDLIGLQLKLWKEKATISNKQFKGKAEVYVLKPNF